MPQNDSAFALPTGSFIQRQPRPKERSLHSRLLPGPLAVLRSLLKSPVNGSGSLPVKLLPLCALTLPVLARRGGVGHPRLGQRPSVSASLLLGGWGWGQSLGDPARIALLCLPGDRNTQLLVGEGICSGRDGFKVTPWSWSASRADLEGPRSQWSRRCAVYGIWRWCSY